MTSFYHDKSPVSPQRAYLLGDCTRGEGRITKHLGLKDIVYLDSRDPKHHQGSLLTWGLQAIGEAMAKVQFCSVYVFEN